MALSFENFILDFIHQCMKIVKLKSLLERKLLYKEDLFESLFKNLQHNLY